MPRQQPDARGQLSTAAAAAKRDKLRDTPRIAGSGPEPVASYDKALRGSPQAPAQGASSGSSRPRIRMPGGGDAA